MTSSLKIALIQKELKDSVKSALESARNLLSKLNESHKIDIIVFPESWLVLDLYHRADEIIENYYSILEFYKEEAIRIGSYLIGGALFKEADGRRYIVSPIISKQGKLIGEQYKINLFRVEKEYFETRPELVVFEVNGNIVGVEICYDINFPEISRYLLLNHVDIIINPSRIIANGEDMWHLYLKSRMLENRVPVIGVNVYYPKRYNGDSIAITPVVTDHRIVKPKVLARLGVGEKIEIVEVNPIESRELRMERIKEIKKVKDLSDRFKVIKVS